MPTTTESARLRNRLVDDLITGGHLRSPHWQQAFRAERRENYVARFAVPNPTGPDHWHDLTDPASSDAALAAVYGNTSLTTHYDENGNAISSSSQPSMMAIMLEQLDAHPGRRPRVLEVGLATGYNCGLLCRALGADRVVSVDLDPEMVRAGRAHLHRAGHEPVVFTGDGAEGARGHGRFDRIIATCAFDRVPGQWLAQCAPDAVIVVNIGLTLVRLTLGADGSASGPIVDYASFMPRRATTATVAPDARGLVAMSTGRGQRRRTVPAPHDVSAPAFRALCSLVFPTVRYIEVYGDGDGIGEHRWIDTSDGSWSRLVPGRGEAELVEDGPRSVWSEIAELRTMWDQHGRRDVTRYGLTVRPDGAHVLWLDDPAGPARALR